MRGNTTKAMKIKIPVAILIEAAEARKAQLSEHHETRKGDYESAMKEWRKACVKALAAAAAEAKAGDLPDHSSSYRKGGYLEVPLPDDAPDRPSKPAKSPNTDQIDRDLALLRATTEETLIISTDDAFAGYLS